MNGYWYFWLGFAAVGLVSFFPFRKLIGKARELSGWKETYKKEVGVAWKELKTIKDINDFYDGKNSVSYLEKGFLLERKALLLSRVKELEQKKEFAKDMIPLLIQSILPEIIALFFLGISDDVPLVACIVAIVFLALYMITVFFFSFKLLSITMSPKTADVLRDEYELRCIDKLIDKPIPEKGNDEH